MRTAASPPPQFDHPFKPRGIGWRTTGVDQLESRLSSLSRLILLSIPRGQGCAQLSIRELRGCCCCSSSCCLCCHAPCLCCRSAVAALLPSSPHLLLLLQLLLGDSDCWVARPAVSATSSGDLSTAFSRSAAVLPAAAAAAAVLAASWNVLPRFYAVRLAACEATATALSRGKVVATAAWSVASPPAVSAA